MISWIMNHDISIQVYSIPLALPSIKKSTECIVGVCWRVSHRKWTLTNNLWSNSSWFGIVWMPSQMGTNIKNLFRQLAQALPGQDEAKSVDDFCSAVETRGQFTGVYLDSWWDLFWQAPNVDVATQPTVVLDGANMSSDNQKQRPQQCNATDGFEGLCHVICIYIFLNLFSFVLCGVTFPWDDILELHLYAEELPLLMARTGQIRFWRKQNCRNTRLVAWVCLLKFSWNPKPWYFLYNWMYRTRIAA